MVDFKRIQEEIIFNKKEHGFNTTDIQFELLRLNEEVAELSEAIWKKKSVEEIGEELADVLIYLVSVAYIMQVPDLEISLYNKMLKNSKRVYIKDENGALFKDNSISE